MFGPKYSYCVSPKAAIVVFVILGTYVQKLASMLLDVVIDGLGKIVTSTDGEMAPLTSRRNVRTDMHNVSYLVVSCTSHGKPPKSPTF